MQRQSHRDQCFVLITKNNNRELSLNMVIPKEISEEAQAVFRKQIPKPKV